MTEIKKQLQTALLELLSVDYDKTAALVAEELRVEYPALYQDIVNAYASEYNLGGCGAQMSPLTVVHHCLAELHERGQASKTQTNGTTLWHNNQS